MVIFFFKEEPFPEGGNSQLDCHLVSGASYCLKSKFITGITEVKENLPLIMTGSGRPELSVCQSMALEINSLSACSGSS